MNFNKCKRCGAFFVANTAVCPNCEPKDQMELAKLKNFLEENSCPNSMEKLSYSTGISLKNLNRFLEQDDFSSITTTLNKNIDSNIGIQL